MMFLRRVEGVTRLDRVTNEDVRDFSDRKQ